MSRNIPLGNTPPEFSELVGGGMYLLDFVTIIIEISIILHSGSEGKLIYVDTKIKKLSGLRSTV